MVGTEKNRHEVAGPQRVGRHRLSYAEYAAEMNVSVDTVKRMVKRGELKVDRVGRKCVRIVVTSN
jgi:excisionase family DNA binding protein